MKGLICTSPGHLDYETFPDPIQENGNAIVRVEKIGICGTDLHAFEGTQPYFTYPRILGHELSGTVEVGKNFRAGDRVAVLPYFSCGHCHACLHGKTNCCTSLKVFGVHIDGGMREYISIPEQFLVSSAGLDASSLALIEPLSIGAHAVRRAGVTPDQTVLVVGIGPIGLGIGAFAKIAGAKVILMDVNEDRLEFSKKTGADYFVNAKKENATERLRDITEGAMPGVIFDATGHLGAINDSFNYMSHGGKYVLVGLQKGNISFSHPEFHKREGTLMSSRNATRQDFDYVVDCVKKKLVDPLKFVTHRTDFTNVKTEFASWLNPKTGVIKALVSF